MKKRFKEIIVFFIICFIASLITKIALNHLTFSSEYLLDSLFVSLGGTIGWTIATIIINRKKK